MKENQNLKSSKNNNKTHVKGANSVFKSLHSKASNKKTSNKYNQQQKQNQTSSDQEEENYQGRNGMYFYNEQKSKKKNERESQCEMIDSFSERTDDVSIVFNANTGSLKKDTSEDKSKSSLNAKVPKRKQRVLKSEDQYFSRDNIDISVNITGQGQNDAAAKIDQKNYETKKEENDDEYSDPTLSIDSQFNQGNSDNLKIGTSLVSDSSKLEKTEISKIHFKAPNKKSDNPYKILSMVELQTNGITPDQLEQIKARPRQRHIVEPFSNHGKEKKREENGVNSESGEVIDRLTFIPARLWYKIFHSIMVLMYVVTSMMYAYMAAFRNKHPQYEDLVTTSNVCESIFLLHMILNFFKQYMPKHEQALVSEFRKTSQNYWSTQFLEDLIPLIPLQFIKLKRDRQVLFYLIKIIRLKYGVSHYNKRQILNLLKNFQLKQLRKLIQDKPELAKDKNQNLTKSDQIMYIGFMLKINELMTGIFLFAYFIGILWIIMCEVFEDFVHDVNYRTHPDVSELSENFITYYNLEHKDAVELVIISTYFSLTSLTTIGLGDFRPVSSLERLVCAFILLFGVSIFSFIMGQILEVFDQIDEFELGSEKFDELLKFFGTIQKFNFNEPLKRDLQVQIEQYFNYRWLNYQNICFKDKFGSDLYDQMPDTVQVQIFTDFLYEDFLKVFNRFFTIKNVYCEYQPAFFRWNNANYINFMLEILSELEPIFYQRNFILFHELEEQNEIIFIKEGNYDIGFEVNGQNTFVVRVHNSSQTIKSYGEPIGQYGCLFNKQSRFIYMASSAECKGFFLRKHKVIEIMQHNTLLSKQFKEQIWFKQMKLVQYMNKMKQKEIEKIQKLAHIDEYKFVSNKNDDNEMQQFKMQNAMGGIRIQKPEKTKSEFEQIVENIKSNMDQQVKIISESIIQKYEQMNGENVSLKKENEETNYKFIDKCLELDIAKSEINQLKAQIEKLKTKE